MRPLEGGDAVFEDSYSLALPRRDDKRHRTYKVWLVLLTVLTLVTFIIAVAAVAAAEKANSRVQELRRTANSPTHISTIAFGSCTAYDLRPQPIWTEGVLKVEPDAWIWLGDMAYLDTTPVDCDVVPGFPACNCTPTYISYPPHQCMAGQVNNARERFMHQIYGSEYRQFLDFMCPGAQAAGVFPPPGTDPTTCPRPILGVYDDHDFGWNNGNGRLPDKHIYKNLYLDAVGEARDSPRRNFDTGLQARVTLNQGQAGHEIDVIMLDERYYRETMPCSLRRQWCEAVLTQPGSNLYAWCHDFLVDDGVSGTGSCCTKDDDMAVWCAQVDHKTQPLWRAACDPTAQEFGSRPLVLLADNQTLSEVTEAVWGQQAQLWPRLLQASSPLCEVLGLPQRQWLQQQLASSTAPLKLIASGSVVMGGLGYSDSKGVCSGDDWECWQPAQLNLIHTLSNTTTGCVVVLTGDYHFADIKVARPGTGSPYADRLQTSRLTKPVYQVMASGMTTSTARHMDVSKCEGTYYQDYVRLRPLGKCSYMSDPNFGLIQVDWEKQEVLLQIRNAFGGVAVGVDGALQQYALSLETCLPVG